MNKTVGIMVILSVTVFVYGLGQSRAELAKFSSDQAALAVNFHGSTFMLTKDNLDICILDGNDTIRVRGSELKKWPGEEYNRSRVIETQTSKTIQMSFSLLSDSGDTAVCGSFGLKPRPDWIWYVDFRLAQRNPSHYCMGCMGSFSFPLQVCCCDSVVDSLYVILGGNSITNPVEY